MHTHLFPGLASISGVNQLINTLSPDGLQLHFFLLAQAALIWVFHLGSHLDIGDISHLIWKSSRCCHTPWSKRRFCFLIRLLKGFNFLSPSFFFFFLRSYSQSLRLEKKPFRGNKELHLKMLFQEIPEGDAQVPAILTLLSQRLSIFHWTWERLQRYLSSLFKGVLISVHLNPVVHITIFFS